MQTNQKGFTLIEIIAVLIILGILAAVALPRYFDMQDDSRRAALQGALADGHTNLSMAYSRFLVIGGGNATLSGGAITGGGISQPLPANIGDFTASYELDGATNCKVTISGTAATPWVDGMPTAAKEKSIICPWSQ